MSDAKGAVEAAVFAALAGAVSGATVYQDAPNDAPLPLIVIGDLRSKRLPGKAQSADRTVTISIVTLVEAEERAPLLVLQAQIDDALDGVVLEPTGWILSSEFEEDEAVLQEDGETYAGVSTYTVLAFAG